MTNIKPIAEEIAASLARAQAKAEELHDRLRGELQEVADKTGECPHCGRPAKLDFEASLEESERHKQLMRIFRECGSCRLIRADMDRLSRAGVPQDVIHASFDNYALETDVQREAKAAAREFMHPGCDAPVLILHGTHGTGKTHLATSILRSAHPQSIRFVAAQSVMLDMHAADFEDRKAMIERLHRPQFLALDEIGGANLSEDTPETFYAILGQRITDGKKTVITSNLGQERLIATLGGSRAQSRLADAIRLNMTGQDWRMR